MATLKMFNELYPDAANVNRIIKDNPIQEDLGRMSEDDVKAALKDYGISLGGKLKGSSKLEKEAVTLLKFLNNIKIDDNLFECSDPLSQTGYSFKDIAGLSDVKQQLEVNYIWPFSYPKLFPGIAKGILFYGSAGTGKSSIARAATAEIKNAAFFAPSPGELRGKYEGETEKNIANVFKCADKLIKNPKSGYKFAIIFFDEFDSLAGQRGDDPGMTRSVNALLQAMDGIKSMPNVSVIAATNYPKSLDEAILRRFSTRIFIDLPDPPAIEFIIRSALAGAYGNPDMTPQQRRLGAASDAFLKNIKTYGAPDVVILPSTLVRWGTTEVNKYVDEEYIKDLISKFGPSSDGKAIIQEVKNGGIVKPDDKRLEGRHIFGYSPSDITKIMELGVKRAATRSLGGYVNRKGTYEWGSTYYIINPQIEKDTDEFVEVMDLSPAEKLNVISFDIRRSDIDAVIKDMASTVDNQKYLDLLSYSKQA